MTGSSLVNKFLDFIASTAVGQFLLKRVDFVLRRIEKLAKCCVYGETKDNQILPWPIFWLLVFNIQIFRVIVSTILVYFNMKPIESEDVLKEIQKWRRSLRCTHYKGTRIIKEGQRGKGVNGTTVSGSPSKHKKRDHNDMLEYDLLEELLNRTLSEISESNDSTFVPTRSEMSINDSSNISDAYPSGDLQHTDPPTKSDQLELTNKSNEATFESATDSEGALTGQDSSTSHDEENQLKSASNSELSGADNESFKSEKPKKGGKESLNEFTDPTDVLLTKLTEMHGNGKSSGNNKQSKRKGRKFSLTVNEKLLYHQKPVKSAKSNDALDRI